MLKWREEEEEDVERKVAIFGNDDANNAVAIADVAHPQLLLLGCLSYEIQHPKGLRMLLVLGFGYELLFVLIFDI